MRKFAYIILSFLMMFTVLTLPVNAENAQKVFDNAGLLSEAKITELQTSLTAFENTNGLSLSFATTAAGQAMLAQNLDTLGYTEQLFNDNNMGTGTGNDGALLMIDMANREVVLYTNGEFRNRLDDSRAQVITDSLTTYLSSEDFDGAADQFVTLVQQNLSEAPAETESQTETSTTPESAPANTSAEITVSTRVTAIAMLIICPLIVFFAGTGIVRSRYKRQQSNVNRRNRVKGKLNMTLQEDRFLETTSTRRRLPEQDEPPRRQQDDDRRTKSNPDVRRTKSSSTDSKRNNNSGGGRSKF